jgi:hypothetical protein
MRKKLVFLLLFLIPLLLVSLPGLPHWIGRAIGASIFVFGMTSFFFWVGLDFNQRIIPPSAKLSRPEFDDIRPTVEYRLHLLTLAFGVFFFIVVALPLTRDLVGIFVGDKPTEIVATPTSRSVPLFGVWFLMQFVRFSPSGHSYPLFYSVEPLRVGEEYDFVVLPHSHLILDFRQSGG